MTDSAIRCFNMDGSSDFNLLSHYYSDANLGVCVFPELAATVTVALFPLLYETTSDVWLATEITRHGRTAPLVGFAKIV
jgi:hypothetical protein